jgi:peptide/nickel transport system permease protein
LASFPMTFYLIKRVAAIIPVLFGVTFVVFLSLHMLPGDAAMAFLGPNASPEALRELRAELRLDRNIIVQFGTYLSRFLRGDFGRSIATNEKVINEILRAFPITIELTIASALMGLFVGIVVGIIAAIWQNSIFDFFSMSVVLIGVSMPIFWSALMLILLFSLYFGLLPVSGVIADGIQLVHITHFYIIDSILTQNWPALRSTISHLILPTLAMTSVTAPGIARMTRSSMIEVLRQNYIYTARSKGLSEWVIISKHALKNALIPIITVAGMMIGNMLSGAILAEIVFARSGVGRMVVDSIYARDYPLLQGLVVFVATFYVLINLVTDIAYSYIDPRVKASYK